MNAWQHKWTTTKWFKPLWTITKCQTILIPKDPQNSTIPSNLQPRWVAKWLNTWVRNRMKSVETPEMQRSNYCLTRQLLKTAGQDKPMCALPAMSTRKPMSQCLKIGAKKINRILKALMQNSMGLRKTNPEANLRPSNSLIHTSSIYGNYIGMPLNLKVCQMVTTKVGTLEILKAATLGFLISFIY